MRILGFKKQRHNIVSILFILSDMPFFACPVELLREQHHSTGVLS